MSEDTSPRCQRITALAQQLQSSVANKAAIEAGRAFIPTSQMVAMLELLNANGYAVMLVPGPPSPTNVRRSLLRIAMHQAAQAAVELAADPDESVLPRDYATELWEQRLTIADRIAAAVDSDEYLSDLPELGLLIADAPR